MRSVGSDSPVLLAGGPLAAVVVQDVGDVIAGRLLDGPQQLYECV